MVDRKTAKEVGLYYEDFLFKISADDLYVYLDTPLPDKRIKKKFLEKWSEIKKYLQEEGIRQVLPEPEELEGKIIVAKGILPKDGTPERIELFPKFQKLIQAEAQELLEKEAKEKINLREEFQKIFCAVAEEPIAKWFPLIPPSPGINVWGDSIPAPPLKELKLFELGENVYLNEEEKLIKAKVSGVVHFDKRKLSVFPEYTLKGDVDFSVGNIYFIGKKLIIQGDIKYGFLVHCRGDLELKGCTENRVEILVEGTFISEGVIRGEDTKVKVKGLAKILGVEFAKLEIEGPLIIKNHLLFSQTLVLGDLIAEEGKGIIYGGEVRALGHIRCKILGHPAQTKTIIGAGYFPDTVEGYLHLLEKKEIYIEALRKIEAGIELGEKLKKEEALSSKKLAIFQKLTEEREKIQKSLKEIQDKLEEVALPLKELRTRTIKVLQKVYPNVILSIADFSYTVNSETNGPITFYWEELAIRIRTG